MIDPTPPAPSPRRRIRRVLVVDDQQAIHDTFDRIFTRKPTYNDALDEFESRFLTPVEAAASAGPRSSAPEYCLTHALSGEEACERVRESIEACLPFSVAFVDMRMPLGWDGLETTLRLWQIDPTLQVVICTAHSDYRWEDVLERLGYNDRLLLLKKPFESDEVRQLALALSEKSRLEKSQERKLAELQREVQLRKRVEEELREMALRDTLTSLPNRTFLLQRLDGLASRRVNNPTTHHAILFLDLDNFKLINDSLGHDAGDDLLNQVANRLRECVRQEDLTTRYDAQHTTVRLGGDEFVVLLEQLGDPKDALVVARRIVKRVSEPFLLGDRPVNVGTSVGVAFIDHYVRDGSEALRNADTAMYRAKQSGKGRVAIFDQTMHEAVCARLELEDQLRTAIRDEGFSLRFQPIIDLQTGTIRGVEVLIRWKGRDGKFVSPADFIPIVEEIGLIGTVGEWVIEKATGDFGEMLRSLPDVAGRDLYVGVNVSRRQLSDPFFLERLNAILERTGFDRRRLKLEMTESPDSRHGEQLLQTLLELQHSGIGIHVDDFGKGQLSLTCFQNYPIETVKIDRSFTASIARDHSHSVITQAMVQLAHHLSAQIVAEGVESEEQARILRKWGCDLGQGYFFAPPLSISELRELILAPSSSPGLRRLHSLISTVPILPLPLPDGRAIQLSE